MRMASVCDRMRTGPSRCTRSGPPQYVRLGNARGSHCAFFLLLLLLGLVVARQEAVAASGKKKLHTRAMTNLGYCYMEGRGVPVSHDRGFEAFRSASVSSASPTLCARSLHIDTEHRLTLVSSKPRRMLEKFSRPTISQSASSRGTGASRTRQRPSRCSSRPLRRACRCPWPR